MELLTIREIVNEVLGEEDSILGDSLLVAEGRAMIYGPPGYYKSFAAQQLCMSIASGQSWFSYLVPKQRNTLYVQAEITPKQFQNRSVAMLKLWPSAGDKAFVSRIYDFNLSKQISVRRLIKIILDSKAELVVIDPLSEILDGSENNDEHARKLTRALNSIRRQTKALIILVHHERKGSAAIGKDAPDHGQNDLRGSGVLIAWPDSIMHMRATNKRHTVEMRWEKLRNAEIPPPKMLTFNKESLVLEESDYDVDSIVRKLIADNPMGVIAFDTAVMESSDIGQHKARQYRKDWIDSGLIKIERDPRNRTRLLITKGANF